ncbi:hypothetical protein [Paraburkholderia sp.]|uniref:exodeoxyribonuclease X C-terminal domain-containing protein n=1 Tax=Paraburkholderia sp. TaxID=1926495 RepID=UPI0039E2548C
MSDGNTLDDKLNFGKYKGRTIREVMKSDPGYLCWLRDNILNDKRQIFLANDVNAALDVWLITTEGKKRSKGQFRNWSSNPPDVAAMNREVKIQIEKAAADTGVALHLQSQQPAFNGYGNEWGAF